MNKLWPVWTLWAACPDWAAWPMSRVETDGSCNTVALVHHHWYTCCPVNIKKLWLDDRKFSEGVGFCSGRGIVLFSNTVGDKLDCELQNI